MVVYIHSYYLEAENFSIAIRLQKFVGSITSAAVPLFYTISGFLFFKGCNSISDCQPKIKKRIRTLLVPYVIWNLLFVAWYLVLAYTPGVTGYVNSDMLSQIQWRHPIDTFYFLFIKPAGFHLWFLRDLLLFVFISPIIYYLIIHTKWISLFIVFLLTGWITRFWMTFFVFGGIIANHFSLEKVKGVLNVALFYICLVFYIMLAILKSVDLKLVELEWLRNYFSHITALLGVITIWKGYDLVYKYKSFFNREILKVCCGFTFFIYLFHEPAFNIIKKVGLRIFGCNEISLGALYLINPLIMVAIAILIGLFFKRYLFKIYSISVGGR